MGIMKRNWRMNATTVSIHSGLRRHGRRMVKVFTVVVILGAMGPWIAAAQETSPSSWKKLPDMALPRWEAATVVLDDKLYLAGGSRNGATPQPGMWVRRAP